MRAMPTERTSYEDTLKADWTDGGLHRVSLDAVDARERRSGADPTGIVSSGIVFDSG